MSSRRHDEQQAAASVAALAAITEEQLAARIREALLGLVEPVMALYQTGTWPVSDFDARAVEAFNQAQRVVSAGGTPVLEAMVAAAAPVLGMWWPDRPAEACAVHEAVERLRYVAMVLPSLVANARGIAETQLALGRRPTYRRSAGGLSGDDDGG
ncbi:hypothetical protein [Catenuloplanes japonicus]|uniref:hypothetical protein n=1 Tax=Catenuloplanes japonicus TaxID=33876 RepID=UPI000525C887|nr:hypothetical protein [Catenuloplanes japonicus]